MLIIVGVLALVHLFSPKNHTSSIHTSVKGSSITNKKIVAPTDSEIIPSITPHLSSKINSQSANSKKQYGAWYWRPSLGRAQMWIGTDSQGNDIYTDELPTPTSSINNQQSNTSESSVQCANRISAEYDAKMHHICQDINMGSYIRTDCPPEYLNGLKSEVKAQCGVIWP